MALFVKREADYVPHMGRNSLIRLTGLQCRLARTALRWTMEELASHAGVSKNTVNHLEKDLPSNLSTQEQLRRTFEAHGIEFINSNGLRVKTVPAGKLAKRGKSRGEEE